MTKREDLESFFIRMGLDHEEVEDGMWLLTSPDDGVAVVAHCSPPLLVLRLKVMKLPAALDDAGLAPFFRRLLELNANDIMHGSYGIEEGDVILSDALELETLEFHELRSSLESLSLAASGHFPELAKLVPVSPEG